MTTWNYRVFKQLQDTGEHEYTIHEVYYDDEGMMNGWSAAAIPSAGFSKEELQEELTYFSQALEQPTLILSEDGNTVLDEEET